MSSETCNFTHRLCPPGLKLFPWPDTHPQPIFFPSLSACRDFPLCVPEMLLSCKTCLHAAVLTGLPRILPGPQGPSPALQLPGVRRLILAHTGRQVPHDLFGHPSSTSPAIPLHFAQLLYHSVQGWLSRIQFPASCPPHLPTGVTHWQACSIRTPGVLCFQSGCLSSHLFHLPCENENHTS